jgi:hypothetical protein
MRLPLPRNRLVALTLLGAVLTALVAAGLVLAGDPVSQNDPVSVDRSALAGDSPTPNPSFTPAVSSGGQYEEEHDEEEHDEEEHEDEHHEDEASDADGDGDDEETDGDERSDAGVDGDDDKRDEVEGSQEGRDGERAVEDWEKEPTGADQSVGVDPGR